MCNVDSGKGRVSQGQRLYDWYSQILIPQHSFHEEIVIHHSSVVWQLYKFKLLEKLKKLFPELQVIPF